MVLAWIGFHWVHRTHQLYCQPCSSQPPQKLDDATHPLLAHCIIIDEDLLELIGIKLSAPGSVSGEQQPREIKTEIAVHRERVWHRLRQPIDHRRTARERTL